MRTKKRQREEEWENDSKRASKETVSIDCPNVDSETVTACKSLYGGCTHTPHLMDVFISAMSKHKKKKKKKKYTHQKPQSADGFKPIILFAYLT